MTFLRGLIDSVIDKIVDRLYEKMRPYIYQRVKAEKEKLKKIIDDDQKLLAHQIASLDKALSEEQQELHERIKADVLLAFYVDRDKMMSDIEQYIKNHHHDSRYVKKPGQDK